MDDALLLADAILTRSAKRHQRIKGYYICINCSNQYIYNRPYKKRYCPLCNNTMHLVSKVDEYEIERIKSWAGDLLKLERSNA